MHGLLNINKPAGMTSRRVVDLVCAAAGTKKVGHAGTLDPMATGVLVVCIGWTTRLISFVQQQRKEYRAQFRLGCTSDTDDVTGTVVETGEPGRHAPAPGRDEIEALLPRFVGRIVQVPPQFSAVHVQGRRAHQLARKGAPVEIPPREVDVHRLELRSYDYPQLELDIECGSGTYVRSIGRDLGRLLGCGAVMSGLVRTRIGEFRLENALDLAVLTRESFSSHCVPPLAAVAHLPSQVCTADELREIGYGRPIGWRGDGALAAGASVALIGPDGQLIAVAEYNPARHLLLPRRQFVELQHSPR